MFLRSRLGQKSRVAPAPVPRPVEPVPDPTPIHPPERGFDPFSELKIRAHRHLIEIMRKQGLDDSAPAELVRSLIREALDQALASSGTLVNRQDRESLSEQIYAEARGLGPLEPLIADDSVSEIMVNGPHRVYVERGGRLEMTHVSFFDDRHVLRIIDRIVSRVGRHVDESTPMCDARLPDGSRVNAIIPPVAIDGPALTIRKFRKDPLKIADLLAAGSLTEPMATFLQAAVAARLNILISGGTGSGKTTLLNVLSSFIPAGERLITIEDAAELQLQQPHVIRLETRPANAEGAGAIEQAELLKNCLRMRPDRIIIGEVRGKEALTMLQAMNTGHEGSLATVHANSCREALARLETMVLMAGTDLPLRATREQAAAALDLLVQTERSADGRRRIVSITEVVGMEGDTIQLQELFTFQRQGLDGEGNILGQHRPTGLRPRCAERLALNGCLSIGRMFGRTE